MSSKALPIEPDDFDYDDDDFQPCAECDLPDACADFGCAKLQGLKRVQGDWDMPDDILEIKTQK